jgi:predicted amidohydrolase
MHLKESRIALAQCSAVLGNVEQNIVKHVELAERALKAGANAIVFPELSLTGYLLRDLNFEVALDPHTSKLLDPLRTLSAHISIVCGTVEADPSGAVFNSALFLEEGEVKHIHRKVYPPSYGLFEEMRYFSRGTQLRAFDSTRLGRIGLLVCEDLWHPSLPYLLGQDGAQMVITIAASPTRLTTGSNEATRSTPENYIINHEHHASFARLFGIYIAFVNRVGVEDGVNFWGGSEMLTPSGATAAKAAFFDEDLQIAEVMPSLVKQARQFSRHSVDEDLALTRQLFDEIFTRTRSVECAEEMDR